MTSAARLRLVHAGFVLPRNETAYTNMSNGWKKVIHTLGDVIGGEERRGTEAGGAGPSIPQPPGTIGWR